jgi:hypothetical protein
MWADHKVIMEGMTMLAEYSRFSFSVVFVAIHLHYAI